MPKKLLIFGTGTLGEVAAHYFENDSEYELVGFTDTLEHLKKINSTMNKPVWSWENAKALFSVKDIEIFVAIGYRGTNSIRESRYIEVKDAGYKLASYISSRATILTESIGENCFILENNVLQPFTSIGNNVFMWSGNHLGHHSVVEDHVFISSHVVISGKCRIGRNSFLGVNSCLYDGVTLGEYSVVGAGTVIADSCPPRSVFVSAASSGRIIRRDVI